MLVAMPISFSQRLILIKRTAAPGATLPCLTVAGDDGQRPVVALAHGGYSSLVAATTRAQSIQGDTASGTNGPLCAACTLFLTGKSSPKSAGGTVLKC